MSKKRQNTTSSSSKKRKGSKILKDLKPDRNASDFPQEPIIEDTSQKRILTPQVPTQEADLTATASEDEEDFLEELNIVISLNNQSVFSDTNKFMEELKRLYALIKKYKKSSDEDIINILTQYTLIKSCGILEHAMKSVIADFHSNEANDQIKKYLDSTIRDVPFSTEIQKISSTIKKFDEDIQIDFKDKTKALGKRYEDAIKSLRIERHKIAHGRSSTISFNDIVKYYTDGLKVLEALDQVHEYTPASE